MGGEREMQHVVVKKGKKSALSDVFAEVKVSFERWRMAGLYVDADDLLSQFESDAERVLIELKTKRTAHGGPERQRGAEGGSY